jgi:O-antigen/teichoic acid export membrane protein
VAGYAVVQRFFMIAMLGQYFVTPLWPAYGEAMARGERVWARKTMLRSIVLSSLVNLLGIVAVCVFARPAIRAWVDPTLDVPASMIAGLALWFAILGVLNCLNALLSTASLVRRQVVPFAAATAVAVVAKVVGAWHWGPAGVAWSYVISYGFVYLPAAALIAFHACAAPPSTSGRHGSEAKPEAGRSQEGG